MDEMNPKTNCETLGCTVKFPHTHEIITASNNPNERAKTAEEIANQLWTQITKQMKFIGIITPETPNYLRMWIREQIKSYADSVAEERYRHGCVDTIHNSPMYAEGFRAGQERMRERAMKVVHGHAMSTPQCDCHENRYSCDSYKETDIRSLEVEDK